MMRVMFLLNKENFFTSFKLFTEDVSHFIMYLSLVPATSNSKFMFKSDS